MSGLDRDRWQAVSPLLDRALEMEPEELGAWLATLRREQPALAADLEWLLGDRDLLGREGFLESAAVPDSLFEGVGPYRSLRLLGEGGMGVVYLAEQTDPIRREVALKVIKLGMDTKQVIARFEAERQALALMDHPAVAKVLDAGSTPEGRPYFVMEYVSGRPITEHCDLEQLTTAERLELFLQVCDGVQHAHQKAIIHRDLKPSNILVSVQDGKAVPKIIDFGVAKATDHKLTERTLFTEVGALIGTPAYMSPEQADLTVQDVDTRTDVYALGVVLYELLVGSLPLEPKALRAAGYDEIRRMIREQEPPTPSKRLSTLGGEQSTDSARQRRVDVPTLRRQLAGELDWITMKALEKERARRYGSPAELAEDLRRCLRNEPVSAGPPGAAYRARKFVRRHRFGVAAAVVATLALVGFAGAMALQAERIAREAESKRRVAEFLTELFRVSEPSEARGNSITAREMLDKGAARIRETLAQDPQVRAELMMIMGRVYRDLGLLLPAQPLLEEALETRRQVLGRDDQETLRLAMEVATLYNRQGRYKEAEALQSETIEIQKRTLGPEDPDTLRTMNNLSTVYYAQARLEEAEVLVREVFDIRRRTLGPEHQETLSAMNNLAMIYSGQGRHKEAETLQREGLDIHKRVLGADHPATFASMSNLAIACMGQGRYDEAEALFRETLDVERRVLGPEHPSTLDTMGNLAVVYLNLGRQEEAEPLLRETLALCKRVLGPEHPNTLATRSNLASAWIGLDRHEEAVALGRETLEIQKRVRGPEHASTLATAINLASALSGIGRYEEADALYRESLEIQRRVLGPDHPDTASATYGLACTAALRGERREALRYLREAVEHGYSNVDWMLEDGDLESLRGDPEFEAIVALARGEQKRGE